MATSELVSWVCPVSSSGVPKVVLRITQRGLLLVLAFLDHQGLPPLKLSPSSSFDLMNSFWTTSSCWFTWRNCAQRESAKPEERESGSGRLGTKALGMGVENPTMASGVLDLTSRGKRCPSASTWWDGSGSSQDVSVLGPIIWGSGCDSIDECANHGICGIIAYIIPVNACTWWVRPRKASTVMAGGPGFDIGGGNPELLNIL
ncbi:hypothetical protein B296_00005835 [Ensete ventricosum]|uniref:Uncharacterized protein n=1 Tax=Ensete ventricosum TaxID=4639 RepID=A0A427B6A4_ENSVE|nr:hypothetical protein B296_00005835 [Ensete ventricosum]